MGRGPGSLRSLRGTFERAPESTKRLASAGGTAGRGLRIRITTIPLERGERRSEPSACQGTAAHGGPGGSDRYEKINEVGRA
jgi:hypothetical protein